MFFPLVERSRERLGCKDGIRMLGNKLCILAAPTSGGGGGGGSSSSGSGSSGSSGGSGSSGSSSSSSCRR